MLRSRAGRDRLAGRMDISLKVKNSRWVSNLDVGVVHRSELMMSDYPVLLEEVADGEAEARVVMHRASGPFRSWAVTVVVVPWTRERWLLTFGRLVGGCVVIASRL